MTSALGQTLFHSSMLNIKVKPDFNGHSDEMTQSDFSNFSYLSNVGEVVIRDTYLSPEDSFSVHDYTFVSYLYD